MNDTRTAVIDTRGSVDLATLENGTISIAGWIAPLDGSPIDTLEVLWNGEPLLQQHLDLRLPSPDVAAVYPEIHGSDRCRFLLRAPATARARDADVLVSLLPRAGGRPGRRLYKFLSPSLPLPPKEHIDAIGGEFTLVALEMLDYFIERAGLQPHHRVLDVGCGVGRIAYALAYYLDERGSFDGVDVMRPLIEWATANLASRRPNFHFQHVDIYNGMYNPKGTLDANTFSFPYKDAAFDLVTVTSVFTHIQRRELRHYLDEIGRVLAPGGRVAATAFIITRESAELIRAGKSSQPLVHHHKGALVANTRTPEAAVGYQDADIRGWIEESGLRVASIYPGSWCGRSGGLSYQDLLVLERSPAGATGNPGSLSRRVAGWRG